MALLPPPASLAPLRATAQERHASWLELFFDLVFVAAVAALAARLHEDHSLEGLAVFAGLFVPVWWAWMAVTWYMGGFGEADGATKVGLLAAMVAVAGLAAGVDGAASGDSGVFVVAYAALLGIVTALYVRAYARWPEARPVTLRYALGDLAGAALWLASLLVDEGWRPVVWGAAMVVLAATPVAAVFSVNWRSHDESHIAERYGLFTLIVLGESVVVTVAGLDTGGSATAALVAVLGFVAAAAIWWGYFERFRAMPGSGEAAGFVWAQGHLLVFAGVAAAAVGVEFCVEAAARGGALARADTAPLGAGLAAYLCAMAMIRAATRTPDWVVALRAGTGAAVLAFALLATGLGPVALVAGIAAALACETAFELRRAPASG